MKPFVFSADSHIQEPDALYVDGLPASLKRYALQVRKDGDYLIAGTDEKQIHRLRLGKHRDIPIFAERRGTRELPGRFEDMDFEGIDAEICFPQLGLWIYAVGNPDAEAASARLFNDWSDGFLEGHQDRLVKCGMLPVMDFSCTLAELDYLAGKGYKAAMLPLVSFGALPKYNSEAWDPVFAKAAHHGIVFVMHSGTGLESVVSEKGPGGAIINYAGQAMDAMNTAMYLISGGVLDRNPGAKVAFIETGASWLAALGERMDEVAEAHLFYVRPKLSRKPSQIIDDQVWAGFQHDRACIVAADKKMPGSRNIMWGSDYPHAEGTWPVSRNVVDRLFEDLAVSEATWRDAVGLNAARLFGIEPTIHTSQKLAA